MQELRVIGSPRPALVDDQDWEWASKYKWHLRNRGYVSRVKLIGRRADGRTINKTLYLHREIIRALLGEQVDHIDRDKLNNTRKNLRLCDNSENHYNAPKRARWKGLNPSSQYKGVTRVGVYKRTGLPRFRAAASAVGCIGYYSSEEEAARAYDAVVRKLSPEFALLNFP